MVSLSPKYSFFLGFLETVKGGLDSVFVSGEDILLMVMKFLSTFKPNPIIFCCLGLLGMFVFGFLFGSSYLRFPFNLFGDSVEVGVVLLRN